MPVCSTVESHWRRGQTRRRRTSAFGAVALLVVIGPLLGLGTRAWQGATPANTIATQELPKLGQPRAVERDDVGDPFVLSVSSGVAGAASAAGTASTSAAGTTSPAGTGSPRYVLFWTTDWRSNVPTAVSNDLVHWRRIADSLPVLPSWAVASRTMTWGPSAVQVPGGWVLYFSTQDAANRLECIGAAFSTQPTGPYVDPSPNPLICQATLGGSIDPSVVHDRSGGLLLVWKSDGNARHLPVGIWEQQLAPDGLSVLGTSHHLLGATQPWEHRIIEGPALLADSKGGWWLFYSGGSWQSNTYDTGVAWCSTPAGPCRRTSDGPLLASANGAISPGGLDTFTDSGGKLWASYSAFPSRPPDARAAMAEDRVLEIAPVLSH